MIESVLFSINALTPIFLIIALGWYLFRVDIINDNFVEVSSKLVMNVTFPIFLVLKISALDIRQSFTPSDVLIIYAVFIAIFLFSGLFARLIKMPQSEIGSFIQGSFRGNFGFVGLALCGSIFGSAGIALAALYLAFLIPLYNLLSVIALSGADAGNKLSFGKFIKKIVLNPLVIAIAIGSALALLNINIPDILLKPADYIASISLPVALLGVGATLQFKNRDYSMRDTLLACVFKLIAMPLIGTFVALSFSVQGVQLGVMFILFSVPTAVVTFPLAKSMGANGKLASAIVVFTCIASLLTMTAGLSLMKIMALI